MIEIKQWIKEKISIKFIAVAMLILLSGVVALEFTKHRTVLPVYDLQLAAADLMRDCEVSVKKNRLDLGISIDRELDPNETGLIGDEFTVLTTTVGNIDAKRTATNPDFAALMVRYFFELGLKPGDHIYVGASSSFPSLIIATLSACKVMDLKPILINSVGSSMYGANIPKFNSIKILEILENEGLVENPLVAVSMGGNYDRAEGMFFPDSQETILEIVRDSGVEFIHEDNLTESIQKRLEVYLTYSKKGKCFVNVGGAAPNFGNTSYSLGFPNGLNTLI